MIIFDIITIFPDLFEPFASEGLIRRAQKKGLIKIRVHNLRDFTKDPHKTIDDKPFGGGIGMVMKIEPIFKAVNKVKSPSRKKSQIIVFTPRGKRFDQKTAYKFSRLNQIVLICGRYEGIDERVLNKIADQNISLGDFIMMGGEAAAMAVIESVARLIPGVLGKPQLLKERVTKEKRFVEYPQYTRPEVFEPKKYSRKFKKKEAWKVPRVLTSGHHKKIEEWRKKRSRII